jgi:hypothetical protein
MTGRPVGKTCRYSNPSVLHEILFFVTTITVRLAAMPNFGNRGNLDRVNE